MIGVTELWRTNVSHCITLAVDDGIHELCILPMLDIEVNREFNLSSRIIL